MKSIEKVFMMMLLFTCFFSSAQASSDSQTSSPAKKTEIRYYYFPNLEAYFDLQEKVYLYKEDGEWVEAEELPKNYGGYSLYNKVRVSIEDYDGDEPYLLLAEHKKKYPYNAKGRFQNQKAQTASTE
ncbi:hypothetical protein [Flavobacterium wongokense]|uniref:hypothetical protein n=1 Tax=Flavobacterium wongokense TaxID=2910674 RepID=UPI001F317F7A|nr:hypothetical protein [Flavobacterium sp. WG47]MCF6132208.1 hypothetical protein [Flavobacterium sp. WG47]